MSLKKTILISVAWLFLVILGSVGIIWYCVEYRVWPSYEAEERVASLGKSAAVVICIGLFPLWIYAAAKYRERKSPRG